MFFRKPRRAMWPLLATVLSASWLFSPADTARAAGIALDVVDLEDLALAPESFYNGSDFAGGFTSRGAFFNNTFTDFGGGFTAWQGWSYSNVTDQTTNSFTNQYAAYNPPGGGGAGGSPNYAVAFAFNPGDATIDLPAGTMPASVEITNTTWAALVMLTGDPNGFAKQFGGPSGNDPDFFRLTITGLDDTDAAVGAVEFYLADYRFTDNSQDFVIDQWTTVDLTSLAGATKLSFGLESSDTGPFGMNTPAYFALDNLVLVPVPEPGSFMLAAIGGAVVCWLSASRRRTR